MNLTNVDVSRISSSISSLSGMNISHAHYLLTGYQSSNDLYNVTFDTVTNSLVTLFTDSFTGGIFNVTNYEDTQLNWVGEDYDGSINCTLNSCKSFNFYKISNIYELQSLKLRAKTICKLQIASNENCLLKFYSRALYRSLPRIIFSSNQWVTEPGTFSWEILFK